MRPDTGLGEIVRLELMADNIVHVVKLDDAKQTTDAVADDGGETVRLQVHGRERQGAAR